MKIERWTSCDQGPDRTLPELLPRLRRVTGRYVQSDLIGLGQVISIVPASEPEDKATWTLPVTTSSRHRVVGTVEGTDQNANRRAFARRFHLG